MAAAAAAALPALLQPGGPFAALTGSESRDPSKRYKKYELIGQGAQKKVYRAFDEEKGIEVAWNEVAVAELACFREKDQQRVFSEITVLKQLKHKNIMTLFDYWFDAPRFCLVFITEIFPDGTLRQYRRRHKLADLPAIKHWAWQILQGLVYLHGHNPPIIHRDLKCDNIFVSGSSGIVKIGDLGLVTLCKDFSAPQSVLGTPEFMAPELYEEKYDEKVDVYAFGMCLLELATMEYPYAECKNAAQIYKKVMQGIPPASVEKLASSEMREFIEVCIQHDPNQRPEARQLLKHSFFEPIRAAAMNGLSNAASGSHRLQSMTSFSARSEAVDSAITAALASSAEPGCEGSVPNAAGHRMRTSSPGSFPAAAGPVNSGEATAAAAGTVATMASVGFAPEPSSTAMPIGGIAAAAGGAIAAAAAGATSGTAGSFAAFVPPSSILNTRANSLDLQPPPGSIAASLSRQPSPPGYLALAACEGTSAGTLSSITGAVSPLASPPPLSPLREGAPGTPLVGSIAAAAMSPIGLGQTTPGAGSIASSLSPSPTASACGMVPASAPSGGPSFSPGSTCVYAGVSPSPPAHSWVAGAAGGLGSVSSPIAAAVQSSPPGPCAVAAAVTAALDDGGYGQRGPGEGGQPGWPAPQSLSAAVAAATAAVLANGAVAGHEAAGIRSGLHPPGGISSSAAAIAAAAVNAAAAAVAAGSHPNGFLSHGLPAIHEDHELDEDVLFDHDENGCRGGLGSVVGDDDEEDSTSCDGTEGEDGSAGNGGLGMPTNSRSQPVSLQVRSSGQAAATNMALSFAMSFTTLRGVRKKVGFQYDLLHDTASAIAVEMVENLSLNTAEAEAIAAMIQHEVSRHNRQQDQEPSQAEPCAGVPEK